MSINSQRPRNHLHLLFIAGLLATVASNGRAGDVSQLSFDAFYPAKGTCELNELGFMSVPTAKRFKGVIHSEKRGPLCVITIPRATFGKLYQYCALAFVETSPRYDYVCGVTHFAKTSVEFSYGFKYGEVEPPMCSFVCPRAQP